MEIVDYLLARKKAGGSDVTIEQLSVTENGTYSEQGIAYSPVVVDVPAPENSYQLKDVPSGTISTIEDGTDLPMSSLKVGIEPVQDLHGYDHPWAGGAGKNKCNAQNPIVLSQADNIGNQPCAISAGTYTYSWTSSENTAISLTLWNDSTQIGTFASTTAIHGRGNITFTITENATHLRCYYNGATTISDIQVEEGSTATSYEPYSNICPIEGWTAANVTRTGKNLYKGYDVTPAGSRGLSFTTQNGKLNVQGVYNKNDLPDLSFPIYSNSIYPGGGNYQNYIDLTDNNTKPIKAGNYTLSIKSTRQIMVGIYVANELGYSVKSGINLDKFDYYKTLDLSTNHIQTFELNRGGYLGIFIRFSDLHENDDINETIEIQLELGSTATTYEPYNGQTYNIQFRDGDNPLTVYGGTLDVTSGELVVDRVEVDLGTLNYIYYSGNLFTAIISGLKGVPNTVLCNALCSIYVAKEGNRYASIDGSFVAGFNNAPTIAIHDSRFTDAAAFKTAMNGVQLVYELATPTTYHLTPTQVRTLVGNNNIWADTGNIIEGKYFKEL